MSRVLVGVDGSEGSRDALALGQILTEPGGRLVIVHVHPYADVSSLLTGGHSERLLREASESVAQQIDKVLDDRTERDTLIVGGRSITAALQHAALETGADLIAVGSSRRSPPGRVLAGNVADGLLSGAPVPVAIAPRGYASTMRPLRVIGCAFDGSSEAAHALHFTDELARRLSARLQIIGVFQAPSFGNVSVSGAIGYRSVDDALRGALRADLDEATYRLNPGVRATTVLLDGLVAPTLITRSAELDLLVAGSRGYGRVRRVLVGSVSRSLVRGASCPILVVPRPDAPNDEATT